MRRPDVDRGSQTSLGRLRHQEALEEGKKGEVNPCANDEVPNEGCNGRLGARSECGPRPVIQDEEGGEPRHDHGIKPPDHCRQRQDSSIRRSPTGETGIDENDVADKRKNETGKKPCDTYPRLFQTQVDPRPMSHAGSQDAPSVEPDEHNHGGGSVASFTDIEGGVDRPVTVKQHARHNQRKHRG